MPSIYQRSRGVYRITIEAGRDAVTGRRRRLVRDVHGTKKDAQAELARLMHESSLGTYVPPHRETVGGFLQRWLTYMQGRVGDSTLHGYRAIVEQRLIPSLGGVRLQELAVEHIAAVESRWLSVGRVGRPRRNASAARRSALSGKTVLNYHRVLAQALSDAVRWKLIPYNPADAEHMDPPATERKQQPTLDLAGARKLADVLVDDRHGVAIYVLLATGLRAGEVLGLRWQDVDLERGALRVEQQYSRVLKRLCDVKTHRSRRPVALDAETVALLRRHHIAQVERRLVAGQLWIDTGLVFTDNVGDQLHHDALRVALARCLRRAGLQHISPHGLRHTHASLMIGLGAHMKLVQERLGHASFSITADTYSHVQPWMDTEAAARLGRALKGVSP